MGRLVETAAVFPGLGQWGSGQTPDHQLDVPRIDGHAELRLGGERKTVPGILLGPSFQQPAVLRIGGQFRVPVEDPGAEFLVKPVVEIVLMPNGGDKSLFQIRLADFRRNDEVVLKKNVALRLLGVGCKPEPLDLLDQKTGNGQNVEVENGVLRDRAVAHLEDDIPVRCAGFFHLAAGDGPQFVDRLRIAADPGVRGGNGLGRQILPFGMLLPEFPDNLLIDVVACENDLHFHPPPSLESIWPYATIGCRRRQAIPMPENRLCVEGPSHRLA